MAWISVKDSLPDHGHYVIAADIKDGFVWNWEKARYSPTAKRWMRGNGYIKDFSHWMPLPV
jgi:hypothetical protein